VPSIKQVLPTEKSERSTGGFSVVLNEEFALTKNIGRELVFSADLCYNGTNKKPLPLGEVAAKPTERANHATISLSPAIAGALPKGEPLDAFAQLLGVWALPEIFVKQRRNWR